MQNSTNSVVAKKIHHIRLCVGQSPHMVLAVGVIAPITSTESAPDETINIYVCIVLCVARRGFSWSF